MVSLGAVLLKDYKPDSELITPAHRIEKPACPVIDIHTHFGAKYRSEPFETRYCANGVYHFLKGKGIEKAVSLPLFPGRPYEREREKTSPLGSFLYHFAPIDASSLGQRDFEQCVRRQFECFDTEGISGIKIWKDLAFQTKAKGKRIFLSDPSLCVIWEEAAARGWPVLIHAADPPAYFKHPTLQNERMEELQAMPKWCYAQDPTISFQTLMEQQEQLICTHKDTRFIIAHMGSWPSNLRQVAKWLDIYPNMYIDTAACLSELGRQPYTAAGFFQKYQDRILFGTDYFAGEPDSYETWYRFLETQDEYFPHAPKAFPWGGRWNIYGIGLSKEVLEKVYYKNACTLFCSYEP
ncbi:MAG: amidohydrolase family protein [Lachnospiraceae bacterium]|jgi:predicted TIM-barrel fold metal-dependent hydrolase|nr:amidohydrolase family protein [Lachnospiraceae bacterium]